MKKGKKFNHIGWFMLFYFYAHFIQAQNDSVRIISEPKRSKHDTTYIKDYYDLLSITALGVKKSFNIDLQSPTKLQHFLSYKPNTRYAWGLGIDYKWLAIEYTNNFSFIDAGDARKGKTKQQGINFGITGQRIWLSSSLQYFKGLYLNNPQQYDTTYFQKNTEYPIRPDIESYIFYNKINYSFNPRKYSHLASLWQMARQKKSAGAFVVGASFTYFKLNADSSLIPAQDISNYPSNTRFSRVNNQVVGLTAGYVHTFVIKKRWFLNILLVPGISWQYYTSYTEDSGDRILRNKIGYLTEIRAILGYNSDKIYGGVNFSSVSLGDNLLKTSLVKYGYGNLRFFLGYRFKAKIYLPFSKRNKK
jgi:hypothetical protein